MLKLRTSKDIALEKLQHYCAYQDRCHSEVRSKLLKLEIYGDDLEEIMASLIQDKYLDELRFAKSFARGKFRLKKWGRNKIKIELLKRKVSDYCIRKALEEIDYSEYIDTLKSLAEQKFSELGNNLTYDIRYKLTRYLLQKGYEQDLVMQTIEKL